VPNGVNLAKLKDGKKGKTFVKYVQNYLPSEQYSQSQIYFLIDLYQWAVEYDRLM